MGKKLIFIFFFSLIATISQSQVQKETNLYSIKGKDSLYFDRYFNIAQSTAQPAVIFVFGGGFISGTRDNKNYIDYFKHLVNKGYQVFSIDYRLGFKIQREKNKHIADSTGIKPAKAKAVEFVKTFNNAIDIAVEDLFSATLLIIKESQKWQIDTSEIIISGSSAGAITSLQAAFYLANRNNLKKIYRSNKNSGLTYKEKIVKILPAKFNYAGVISFAGAILNYKGKLKWENRPAPIALFHGNADRTVPYNRIWTPIGSFNGSKRIAQSLKDKSSPYLFCTYQNEDHIIAITPMKESLGVIEMFLEDFINKQKNLEVNIITTNISTITSTNNSHKNTSKSQYKKMITTL